MMGQAAGSAAAIAAEAGEMPADIDVTALQQQLRKDGVEI